MRVVPPMPVLAMLITLLTVGLAASVTSVLSATHASVRVLPRGRIRRLRDSGERGGAQFDNLADHPSRLAAARSLAAGISYAAVTACAAWALAVMSSPLPAWADALVAASAAVAAVFSLGEALPRAIALSNPESVGLAMSPTAASLITVLYPPARLLSRPWTAMTSLISGEERADVPWREPMEEHRFGGVEEEDGRSREDDEDLIEAIAGLREKVVREVMIPRPDIIGIEDTATMDEALEAITAAGVSRVPVYHETLDDVRGILYAKDLLLRTGTTAPPASFVRPAMFVPETKPVEELLREMRHRRHIAIVADEYGGTAGLVTIEDLLEEIVGEIFDEYDRQVPMLTELPDGRFIIDARMPVDEIDERFGTSLDVEADTVGGMFTELAGHIPVPGESLEAQGVRFTVEDMEGNRVRQLVVEPSPQPRQEGDSR